MKQIGPTFAAELQAAGLIGLPFAWGTDGAIQFPTKVQDGSEVHDDERMSAAQRSAVLAVYEAHNPAALPDWRPASVAAFKATRDALLQVVNDLMAQFMVMGQVDDARFCLGLIQPLRDSPAHPTLAGAADAADYKHKAITLWKSMGTGAPSIVVAEFARAIGKL